MKLLGGILVSLHPSVRLSVRPSVPHPVSALQCIQFWLDPFHIYTSYQATSEDVSCVEFFNVWQFFKIYNNVLLYARLKNGRIMLWQCPSVCPSVRPSVRPSFPDFFSTCFKISIWNLVYAFSRWHDMSSLSFITIGSLWPSLQPKVGQTQFLQSWPYKSR